jgi:hypothetical protein
MERKRQRELALAAIAIAIAAFAVFRVGSVGAPATPNGRPNTVVPQPAQEARDKSAAAEVDLQALQSERPEPEATQRNPFRFKPKPPPPPPPAPPLQADRRTTPDGTPFETGPLEPPPPPRIPLKFIGRVESGSGLLAVLSDARGVYQGREGEIIEGRYRILKIGVESIELAYLDGRGRQTIRLTGQ